jgi:hypothetical protein
MRHESFGLISARRCVHDGELYEVRSGAEWAVEVSIHHSSLRGVRSKIATKEEEVVTVRMSPVQFANFITMAETPCTLMSVSGHAQPKVPSSARENQKLIGDFLERMAQRQVRLEWFRKQVEDTIMKPDLSEEDRLKVLSQMDSFIRDIVDRGAFDLLCFVDSLLKAEIEAKDCASFMSPISVKEVVSLARQLGLNATSCGLNSDWCTEVVHLGPGSEPNRHDGDLYLTIDDEDRLELVRRNHGELNDDFVSIDSGESSDVRRLLLTAKSLLREA